MQTTSVTHHIRIVTTKGQVTIPLEIRDLLGIYPSDQVLIQVSGDKVEIKRAPMSLKATFGAVPALKTRLSVKKMRDIAIEEHISKYQK